MLYDLLLKELNKTHPSDAQQLAEKWSNNHNAIIQDDRITQQCNSFIESIRKQKGLIR